MINAHVLLKKMKRRKAALQNEIDRDKGGGLADSLAKWQETKYWIEAAERLEFQSKEICCPKCHNELLWLGSIQNEEGTYSNGICEPCGIDITITLEDE